MFKNVFSSKLQTYSAYWLICLIYHFMCLCKSALFVILYPFPQNFPKTYVPQGCQNKHKSNPKANKHRTNIKHKIFLLQTSYLDW